MRYTEILFESRGGFLYHGTSMFSACNAIVENNLRAKTSQRKFKLLLGPNDSHDYDEDNKSAVWGVSLTRNLKIAFGFGYIIFVLDQRQLSYTNKLIPVDYWQKQLNLGGLTRSPVNSNSYEYEEFCVGDIAPLSRYCRKIILRQSGNPSSDFQKFGHTDKTCLEILNTYNNLEITH